MKLFEYIEGFCFKNLLQIVFTYSQSYNSIFFFPLTQMSIFPGTPEQAIPVLQKKIEAAMDTDFSIAGLGNHLQTLGYYQWFIPRWYAEEVKAGRLKDNPYDALSLCLAVEKGNKKVTDSALEWYQSMKHKMETKINKNDQKSAKFKKTLYQVLMGYANLLSNTFKFDKAIKIYSKVAELRSDFQAPLQALGMIYEYKRVDHKKACQYAQKLLKMNPKNLYAMFILARNEKDNGNKIAKLKNVIQKHPKYARAINEVGIVHGGGLNKYSQAIQWYKKAVEVTPEYDSCYNNIGVNYELLKKQTTALEWYFRAIEKDPQYKTPHGNAIDCFVKLKWGDDQIYKQAKKYKVDPFFFDYKLGLAYYDKSKYEESLKHYNRALEKAGKKDKHLVYNSMGITYDEIKQFSEALQCYQKCIKLKPDHHSAYYNTAIVYKKQKKPSKAKEMYQAAIKVNPSYDLAYNNLGNIYKHDKQYEQAIECYEQAIEHNSTYTLALANLGVCYLMVQNYQQAFNALSRAKKCLPTDNNKLSEGNKNFLKDQLQKLDKEGSVWSKQGAISSDQKQKLKEMIQKFEANFSNAFNNESAQQLSDAKILKHEVLEVVKLIASHKFELNKIEDVFGHVQRLFQQNEEYFHILPQLFIQYFWNHTFSKKEPVQKIEETLFSTIKRISQKSSSQKVKENPAFNQQIALSKKPTNKKVNLFKNTAYFQSYEVLFAQIDKVNQAAKEELPKFRHLVDEITQDSEGIPYGVNMKLPENPQDQFKVILRIMEKMFKDEINQQKVKEIIGKVDEKLRATASKGKINFLNIVKEIIGVWTAEITAILKQRKQNQKETVCAISDLVRGKIMYRNVNQLLEAVSSTEEFCNNKKYTIIEFDNRLTKPETRDVVFKIQIGQAVCELQLAMKQNTTSYHLTHALYELERSPLGCIFASYIYMSKRFNYPLLNNCKDIVARWSKSKDAKQQEYAKAAAYIVESLIV